MAGRVGARLADLEFVQFHPTALHVGKDPMPLLTEALRGEGAILVDAHGRRFMPQYHPMAELAPRDIVARAIFWQYDRGLGGAYLDARSIVDFADRFPTVNAHAHSVELDPSEHLLPVSPAAHYYMGGIDADANGRTSVPGLWAVGECSSTGVHGANRLASNSLLEGLVFGARTSADVATSLVAPDGEPFAPKEAFDLPLVAGPALEDLRQIMWDRVGLVRTGPGLWEARNHLLDLDSVLRRTIAGRVAARAVADGHPGRAPALRVKGRALSGRLPGARSDAGAPHPDRPNQGTDDGGELMLRADYVEVVGRALSEDLGSGGRYHLRLVRPQGC